MRAWTLPLCVVGLALPATALAKPPKPRPEYKITFVSHTLYEETCETEVCWDVKSPTSQAISNFTLELASCSPTGATVTRANGSVVTLSESQLGAMTSASHPPCGAAGIKFDQGFNDGETKRLCMTYAGMLPLSEAPNTGFVIKAGNACVPEIGAIGPICGGTALCASEECGGGQYVCPTRGGPAICEGSLDPNECGGCKELPGEIGGDCTLEDQEDKCVKGVWDCASGDLNALACVPREIDCSEYDKDCRTFACDPADGTCKLADVEDGKCKGDDDQDMCNGVGEVCDENNGCVPTEPVKCGDGSFCGSAACDPETGACEDKPPCAEGEVCNEETKSCGECTTDEHCKRYATDCSTYKCGDKGMCVVAEASDKHCDDQDVCDGKELCDPGTGCYLAEPGPACGSLDACRTGSCDPIEGCKLEDVKCDDDSECTNDKCDPKVGCTYETISCNDDDACTTDTCDATTGCAHSKVVCQGDACNAADCNPDSGCTTTPVDCEDYNKCTADTCDAVSGCANVAIGCDDYDACTDDTCDPEVGCVHTAITCGDNSACTTDTCDPEVGCVYITIACDDDNACTGDWCDDKVGCIHNTLSCNDQDGCTTDTCDKTEGCMHSEIVCDDYDPCTNDSCQAGGCKFAEKCPVACTTAGTCVDCLSDTDCLPGEVCHDGTCVEPCLDLGAVGELNLIICGSYTMTNTDIEGRAAIAGDFSFSGGVGNKVYAAQGVTDVLIVGGTLSAAYGQVDGRAWYGVALAVPEWFSFLGGVQQGTPAGFSFAEVCEDGAALSATLAGLATTGSYAFQDTTLRMTGTSPTLNVFSIPASAFVGAGGLYIDVPKGAATIINVTGTSVTFANFQTWLGADGVASADDPTVTQIMWNLPEATSLSISDFAVYGSMLAPNATVTFNNGQLNGTLFAKDGSGSGEYHHRLFDADICLPAEDIGVR